MIVIDNFAIDLSTRETLTFEAQVTEHPTETGSNISDHVIVKAAVLKIEAVVSNHASPDVLDHPSRRQGSGTFGALALDKMRALMKSRKAVTVECSYGTLENMVLEQFEPEREAKSLKALAFSASFREVVIVDTQRGTVNVQLGLGTRGHIDPVAIKDENVFVISKLPADRQYWTSVFGKGPILTTTRAQRAKTAGVAVGLEPLFLDTMASTSERVDAAGTWDHYAYLANLVGAVAMDGYISPKSPSEYHHLDAVNARAVTSIRQSGLRVDRDGNLVSKNGTPLASGPEIDDTDKLNDWIAGFNNTTQSKARGLQ